MELNVGVWDSDHAAQKAPEAENRHTQTHTIRPLYDDDNTA